MLKLFYLKSDKSILSNLINEVETHFDLNFVECENVSDTSNSDIILRNIVDADQGISTNNTDVIYFYNSKHKDVSTSFDSFGPPAIFIIDLGQRPDFYFSNFVFLLKYMKMKNELLVISDEVRSLNNEIKSELSKSKLINQKLVPIRKEQFGPIHIMSKYKTGTNSGGDFLDVFSIGSHICFMMTNSNSYLTSSVLFGELESLKTHKIVNAEIVDKFIKKIFSGLGVIQAGVKNFEFHLIFGVLNKSFLTCDVWSVGDMQICKNHELLKLIPGQRTLAVPVLPVNKLSFSANDKFYILSPGFHKNSTGLYNGRSLNSYLKFNTELNTRDFVTGIFSDVVAGIKKDEDFSDMSVLTIEVDQNAIHQI